MMAGRDGRDGGSGGGDKRQDSGEPEGEVGHGQADLSNANISNSASLCQQRCVSRQSGAVSAT